MTLYTIDSIYYNHRGHYGYLTKALDGYSITLLCA